MRFALGDPPVEWIDTAPIRIVSAVDLPASPDRVFAVLADHEGWTDWFGGMRSVRIDGAAEGVGALRTVSVGVTSVQERFVVWSPGKRLRLNIVASNVPGLRAMVEDWHLEAMGDATRLTITIGVEAAGPLRVVPGLVRAVVGRQTRGATGIASMFAPT